MAKQLVDKPIGVADLSEYLKSDDDFAFELEILRCCLGGGGFKVQHGGTYQDPVTKKDRQFDIRLTSSKERSVVKLAIECKNLKANFPLLVSRIPRRQGENFHDVLISQRPAPGSPGSTVRKVTAHGTGVIFEANKFVGKSTTQVGRAKVGGEIVTSDADVYEKWSQALGSAFDLVSSWARDCEIVSDNAAATVVFPILVIPDDTLWTIDYRADGQQLGYPKQSKECEIFLRKTIDVGVLQYTTSHLLIFTKTQFEVYLGRLATKEKYWDRLFPSEVLQQLPQRR